ncbi:hypothetical protein [Mesorhizobium sp. CN2-181]|uniref:hypothetical protein n=1 Tax=Mesorhizobium yinganensis TaxID=3157707 RepID=UPI0032B84F6D
MTDDEAATVISTIVADVLTRARAAGLPEAQIACGFLGGALDIAKKSENPAAWAGVFHRYGVLFGAEEGAA